MRIIVVVASALALTACSAFLPQPLSKVDPRHVYAWPMAACPSAPTPSVRPEFLEPFSGIALSVLVNTLVGIPVNAVADAADADKSGLEILGTNARYYGRVVVENARSPTVLPPGCYVVALAELAAGTTSWCDDPGFAAGVPQSCSARGKRMLRDLSAYDAPGKDGLSVYGVTVPEVYAEIALTPSGYPEIVRPRIVALYYPRSLQWARSDDPRNLTLTLDFASDLKPGAIVVNLAHVRPRATMSDEDLADQSAAWTRSPKLPDPDKNATHDNRFLPVTINAKLKEIGQPSAFLRAFAPALGGAKGDIAKAALSEISPAQRESAANQQQANLATEESKRAAVYSAMASYQSACDAVKGARGKPGFESEQNKARAAWLTLIAAERSANVAAAQADRTPQFNPDSVPDCFTNP